MIATGDPGERKRAIEALVHEIRIDPDGTVTLVFKIHTERSLTTTNRNEPAAVAAGSLNAVDGAPRVPECETSHPGPRHTAAGAFGQVTGHLRIRVTPDAAHAGYADTVVSTESPSVVSCTKRPSSTVASAPWREKARAAGEHHPVVDHDELEAETSRRATPPRVDGDPLRAKPRSAGTKSAHARTPSIGIPSERVDHPGHLPASANRRDHPRLRDRPPRRSEGTPASRSPIRPTATTPHRQQSVTLRARRRRADPSSTADESAFAEGTQLPMSGSRRYAGDRPIVPMSISFLRSSLTGAIPRSPDHVPLLCHAADTTRSQNFRECLPAGVCLG
jgi:hypothetical protein